MFFYAAYATITLMSTYVRGRTFRIASVVLAVVLVVFVTAVFLFLRRREPNKSETSKPTIISSEEATRESLATDSSPDTQASGRLLLATQANRDNNLGRAKTLCDEVIGLPNADTDFKQVARRTLAYIYSEQGDFGEALKMAEDYRSHIRAPSDSPEIAERDYAYIDSIIAKLKSGEKISYFGGSEEGE